MPAADRRLPLVPAFDVIINGTPMATEARAHIISIAVDHSNDLPSMFTLEMVDSIALNQEVTWIDDPDLLNIGNLVEIKLGYADKLATLMIGEITGVEPEFAFDQATRLIVRGYDRRHRLQRGRKTRTFVQQKDSDIASQIASDAGLTPQIEDSGTVYDYILQSNQTDLDFLQSRARNIQYEVAVDDKTLLFRPVANAGSAVMTLTMADDLLEFRPRLASAGQVSEVTVRSWSPKDKKELVGQAKVGDEVSTMGGQSSAGALVESAFGAAVALVSGQPVMTQAEADQLAKACFNSVALELITGEGECWGRTDLRAGIVIQIDGVGKRFSGQYYVTSTIHRYAPPRGYITQFTIQRNAS